MQKIVHTAERLAVKSDAHTLAYDLITRYSMSIAEAECLTDELRRKQLAEDPFALHDGQVFYTAIALEEPAGKPLKRCQTRRIRLTLHSPEDLSFRAQHGLRSLQEVVVSRLCFEAFYQGTILAQEDLARLLYLSRATVQRILATYRAQDDYIPTRGNYHDIGPAVSHKGQAIHLYLRGCQPSTIAMRLCHNLSSIERYLDDFCRVIGALDEGFDPPAIARFTGHSLPLIAQYQALYAQYKDNPAYLEPLQALRRRARGPQAGKKGGP